MPTGSSTAMAPDSSSEGGADESDESSESESDMLDVFGGCSKEGVAARVRGGQVRAAGSSVALLLPGWERGFYARGLSGIARCSPHQAMISTCSIHGILRPWVSGIFLHLDHAITVWGVGICQNWDLEVLDVVGGHHQSAE